VPRFFVTVARFFIDWREKFKGLPMPEHAHEIVPLLPRETIALRIASLAREIDADFAGTERLVVIVLLRGAFIFAADLSRAITLDQEIDFMEVSSYGNATTSSGKIDILKQIRTDIAGRDVLVVDDILDTGHTLAHVLDLLRAQKPAKLRSIVLLDKPSRREVDIAADWTGFEIPDAFVIGYGIDYAQHGRNLPFVGMVQFKDT
jgi:hypoxanthine phosphoribosyltransferase